MVTIVERNGHEAMSDSNTMSQQTGCLPCTQHTCEHSQASNMVPEVQEVISECRNRKINQIPKPGWVWQKK